MINDITDGQGNTRAPGFDRSVAPCPVRGAAVAPRPDAGRPSQPGPVAKTRRCLVVGLTLLVGGLVLPLGTAAPAAADTSCYGDYCSGKDPGVTSCADDAVTVQALEASSGGGRLELRWSNKCQTEWARWQQYPVGWCLNCTPLALIAVQDTGYTQELSWSPGDGNTSETSPEANRTYWTPMIYSPSHTVYAGIYMPCGDRSLVGTAFDCAMNGLEKTPAY